MNKVRKAALLSAVVTSIACMGDTILYSVLPVYAESLGISDFWVGLFLSLNRFARLFSHGIIATCIIRFGIKNIVIVSSVGAALSSFTYKSPALIYLMGASRILWGLAYSGFRQATLYYATTVDQKKAEAIALSNVIRSAGPLLILIIGPFLFNSYGYKASFFLIGCFSITGILFSFFLPKLKMQAEKFKYLNVITISWFKILLFSVSFITDGLVVVVLSLLFSNQTLSTSSLLAIVSFYLMLKRLISFLLPLALVKTYTYYSIAHHLYFGMVTIIIGLLILTFGFYEIGLGLLFVGGTITENVAPVEGLKRRSMQKMENVTSVTFWWDLGKAFGALSGILLYKNLGGDKLFLFLGVVLICILLFSKNRDEYNSTIKIND